jgi:hypothetical protein
MTNRPDDDLEDSEPGLGAVCLCHALSSAIAFLPFLHGLEWRVLGLLIFASWIVWPIVFTSGWFRGVPRVAAVVWAVQSPLMLVLLAFMTGRT